MKSYIKLALISIAAVPVLATAQISLYIPTQLDHFDIDGVGGGGPFVGQILSGPNHTVIGTETLYCDSIPQEFSLGQTFNVQVQTLNVPSKLSLDPWVISQANAQAALYDTAHSVSLSNTEITSAIQGVIWNLDGQISGTMTSSDAGTAGFANFLYSQANSIGTYNVGGYVRFSADGNYADPLHPTGTNGQSQIGVAPVPEPSAFLVLGFPLLGLAFRRRTARK